MFKATDTTENTPSTFGPDLPPELWLNIFLYLPLQDAAHLLNVNRFFRDTLKLEVARKRLHQLPRNKAITAGGHHSFMLDTAGWVFH